MQPISTTAVSTSSAAPLSQSVTQPQAVTAQPVSVTSTAPRHQTLTQPHSVSMVQSAPLPAPAPGFGLGLLAGMLVVAAGLAWLQRPRSLAFMAGSGARSRV